MKTRSRIQSRNFWVVALPLFVAVGCAGNRQNVALNGGLQTDVIGIDAARTDPIAADAENTDIAQADTVPQDDPVQTAIATMDGYTAGLAQVEARDVRQSDTAESEEVVATTDATVAEAERYPDAAASSTMAIAAASTSAVDVNADSRPTEEGSHAETAVSVPDDHGILSIPAQLVFYFETGSNMPAASDNDMLLRHAGYLRQHPNRVLMISGHSDSRGPKAYNQRLSEQRAINVAEVLLANGVAGEQLRIDGMGDDLPMADQGHWKQNRRVEFTYVDSMVARTN